MSLRTETFLSLDEVTAVLPGRPVRSTLWRWMTQGLKGHHLRPTKIGGRVFVAESEVQRFVDALSNRVEGATQ
jgi:predicted DNA-binding transcriptional regulator AlpA